MPLLRLELLEALDEELLLLLERLLVLLLVVPAPGPAQLGDVRLELLAVVDEDARDLVGWCIGGFVRSSRQSLSQSVSQ